MAKKQEKGKATPAAAETKSAPAQQAAKPVNTAHLAFGKENYIIMGIGMVVIILGFILMAGTEDIFSFTKITLAPIIVILGFVIEVIAIVYKPKN